MNEQPDDWFDDLRDREENPVSESARNITDDIKDEAIGRVKDKAKDAGKDLAKKAGKEAAKEGGKAAAQAGGEAAAGAASGAAASGGAAATGATVAASTGVETAGIGVVVGAAIAILGNKTLRNFFIGGLILVLLLQVMITISTVLAPIIIVGAAAEKVADGMKALIDGRAVKAVAKAAAKKLEEGVKKGANAAVDGYNYVDDLPGINLPGGAYLDGGTNLMAANAAANAPPTTGSVLAETDEDSRLLQLGQAMSDQGFFNRLATKYGIRIRTKDGQHFDILLRDKVVKRNVTSDGIVKAFQEDKELRITMQAVNDDELHVFDYSKRVTLAEKGMQKYKSQQLFIPGAEEAKEDEKVAKVRQTSLETQNSPFISSMKSELSCTKTDCDEWVPDTVDYDESELTQSISRETGFKTVGTLYSRMKDRIRSENNDEKKGFLTWYQYVKQMDESSKATTPEEIAADSFIQGALNTRKDQASRLWFHWQTATDQYRTGGMTDKSASALFQNFEGGAHSRAYRHLSGQTGGTPFSEYDKINDNQKNIVAYVYNRWREQHPEDAQRIDDVLNSSFLNLLGVLGLDKLIERFVGGDTEKAFERSFNVGSRIMLPTCDATMAGSRFMNCLYAGAEASTRDIGISDYGFSGVMSKEERDRVANYKAELDREVAARKPLFERIASMNTDNPFVRKLVLQAAVPMDSNGGLSSIVSYLSEIPGRIFGLAMMPFNGQVLAAEDETTINNVDRSGIKLDSILNAPLSETLDNPTGDAASCPAVPVDQENMCKADETTYLALAAKFDLLPNGGEFSFNVGSYNILHADHHTPESIAVGGCNTTPVPGDADCSKTRSTRQAQIILGSGGAPKLDLVGLQEVSPKQYGQLKTLLPGYEAFPTNTNRMSNSKDGAVALFWDTAKLTRFTQGKAAGISNTSKDITYPWVGLQASSGQKIYAMSVHYPTSTFGGDAQTIKRASRLTMDWVRSKAKNDTLVVVVGDFNDTLGQKLHYCIYTEDSLLQHAHDMEQRDNPGAGCERPDTGGIDHIYASPTLGVQASNWTHMNRTGIVASASDHEPVYATLTLPGSTDKSVRAATFNILHVGEDPFEQQWRTRMPTSIGVLKRNGIVIAGLQEVRPEQHKLLTTESYATDTYDIFPKTNQQPGFSPNPVIWNKSMFKLVSGKTLPIEYDSGNKIDHAVLVLLENNDGNQVYVLNTHDPANARPGTDQQNALSRLNNAKYYKEYLGDLAKDGIPVILTGDFNSSYTMDGAQQPYDNVAQNLTYCVISSGGVLRNVWDVVEHKSFDCPRDRVPGNAPIDHIYSANTTGVSKVWVAPDRTNGSDHPTVMADIAMPWTKDTGGGTTPVPYQNPVYNRGAADPSVIRGDDKTYFVYATGLTRLSSPDLVHWKKEDGGWNVRGMPRTACHWAPDVAKVGSKYVLTYSAGQGGCLPGNNPDIHYAVGDKAGGPFTYKGTLGLNGNGNFAIDSHLFVDEDGKAWLFYGGGILRLVQVKLEGETLKKVGSPQHNLFDRVNPGDRTVEGWWVTKKNGWYYLYYSYGAWESKGGADEYSTRIARSKNVNGPYEPRNQYKELLTGKDPIRGPGHNSVTVDNAGNEWIVYHGWYKEGGRFGSSRVLMIDPITYRNEWPVVLDGHPSSTLQPNGPATGAGGGGGGGPGGNPGGLVWPVAKSDWPQRSMPVAECGLKYSDGTVHTGIDISVPTGTTLYAAADATVVYKGGAYGAIIAKTNLKAPDGSAIYINYQHMSSITVGSAMKQGDPIGKSGAVGTGSAHLHFGVWKTGSFLSGHDSVSSAAGRATLSKMLHPMNYLPDDGRNVSECRKPYVLP